MSAAMMSISADYLHLRNMLFDLSKPVTENLRCHCKFHRQYLLPCRHIFHLDTQAKVLTPLQWEAYIGMFAECGMEVYETVGTVWVEEEGSGRNFERANIVIRVRESLSRCNSSSIRHMR
ncbi:hypothetical protein L211DRAFT_136936 [Terfezia boudieri ATCC MYA-4762]|uniref:Uncharacterized protein n=1 Tax=Terfezia boudieri ATCC MYA-4762 TaxID=1051890 RepID=A0A3N4LWQ7_9PEZI|nr:hypothetical protein L211DRAFT_136936 [Terfezia boudieri ATCC MYA-4762]